MKIRYRVKVSSTKFSDWFWFRPEWSGNLPTPNNIDNATDFASLSEAESKIEHLARQMPNTQFNVVY